MPVHIEHGHLYADVNDFVDMFDDLNTSIDFKKNQFILKTCLKNY